MPEMEWEFSEGSETPDGHFMATGKVVSFLRAHLAKNEIEQAVALYESCAQSVGDQVWNEFEAASHQTKKSIANLFYRARDYKRSAAACERLGEWVAAGKSYEAAYELARAAHCYLKANDKKRAAAVLEKSGEHRRAAELYFENDDLEASAAALERSGDAIGASKIFIKKGDLRRAAQLLAQVHPNDPYFLHAVGLLSEVLVQLNRRELAIQRLAAVVPRGQRINDEIMAELAYRLGRLMWEAGQTEQARQAFEQVQAYAPRYKDVPDCLAALGRGVKQSAQVAAPFIPAAQTASGPLPQPIGMGRAASVASAPAGASPAAPSPLAPAAPPFLVAPLPMATAAASPAAPAPAPAASADPFASLDGNPFAQKPRPTIPPPSTTATYGLVTRMEGYDVLKKLPIFADLSLDEMKAFFNVCEQASFQKGEVLIEQGRPGESLFILREGAIRVSKVEGGQETVLATLPAGNYVGEMALIDDGPTSARVTAAESVKALRIRRDRFDQLIYTNDQIALKVYRIFVRTMCARLRESNAHTGRRS